MKVYKGFNADLTCTKGKGRYQFKIGRKEVCEGSKTRNTGFHASEYILECLYWYPLNGNNRYFLCEAEGSVDEDGEDIICCTEITPVRELRIIDIVFAAMEYMIDHPKRAWEKTGTNLCVARDKASVGERGIAIARGKNPKVKGGQESYIGLVRDDKYGCPDIVRMFRVGTGGIKPNVWYALDDDGELVRAGR